MTPEDDVVERELGPLHVSPGTRRPIVFAIALLVILLPAALIGASLLCGDGRCGGVANPTPDVASPVEGVVIDVDVVSLTEVRGFTLRVDGGIAFTFVMGDLANPTEFPPSHLAEHQATSTPVRAWFRVEGGSRVVYRVVDASD